LSLGWNEQRGGNLQGYRVDSWGGGGERLELTLVRMFHEINSDIVTFHKKNCSKSFFFEN
jgi:hypothetical protein